MKIAIVHDWLYGGGAEQVVLELHRLYPDAPIYTSYCTDEWRKKLDNKVITGYLQKWPFSTLRKFLPILRQHWFRNLDLSMYDVIISSSGNGEAKFVHAGENAKHICYCHSPTHFYWRKYDEYIANPGFQPKWLIRLALKALVKPLRKRDYDAAQEVNAFIANSSHIQADIKRYYNKESTVIHPPVDIERFSSIRPSEQKSGFVTWGRHVPYKRIDLAIEACNALSLPLTIIGNGPDTNRLKQIAGPTIKFTGWLTNDEFDEYVANAQAFIFPGEEDFGIAPVEAMAAGLPVIAYQSGGALDYVIDGVTGTFFKDQTTASLTSALKNFDATIYSADDIKRHAQHFSKENFHKSLQNFIQNTVQ